MRVRARARSGVKRSRGGVSEARTWNEFYASSERCDLLRNYTVSLYGTAEGDRNWFEVLVKLASSAIVMTRDDSRLERRT